MKNFNKFKKIKSKILNSRKEKGFTLLFAVLVSTLVLSVGMSLISIALKQLVISGTGRESQFAFYAANTGIECAMYWDWNMDTKFPIDTEVGNTPFEPGAAGVTCEGIDIEANLSANTADPTGENYLNEQDGFARFRLRFESFNVGGEDTEVAYCADVSIKKEEVDHPTDTDPDGSPRKIVETTILSRGYNTCIDGPRRIERGLQVVY